MLRVSFALLFDAAQLDEAVAIHEACYGLVRWVAAAVGRGFVAFGTLHQYMSASEAAEAWIKQHFENIPPACRPAAREGPQLARFANYFASYLASSFEIVKEPASQLVFKGGCVCSYCAYFRAGSHLKMKKLRPEDKRRAERLKRDYLKQLALNYGIHASGAIVTDLLRQPESSRDAALAAYAVQLLRRCAGLPTTPAVLALWREIAWTAANTPDKNFKLSAELIKTAEARLVKALTA